MAIAIFFIDQLLCMNRKIGIVSRAGAESAFRFCHGLLLLEQLVNRYFPDQEQDDQKRAALRQLTTWAVDLEGRRLLLEDGDVLPYRHLVVATGSLPSDLGVPGVGLLALGFAQAPALVPWGGALALAALFHGVDESALGLFLWAANLGLWGLAFGEGLGYLLLLLAYGLAPGRYRQSGDHLHRQHHG